MKFFLALSFGALAIASPLQSSPVTNKIRATSDPCREVTVLFARGTFEPPPLGLICGPPTANGLKKALGNKVTVKGVDYPAAVQNNFLPGGCAPEDVQKMQDEISQILTSCPNTKLVVGGYSQGAALTASALGSLPDDQKNKIVAAFLYGDTQYKQVCRFSSIHKNYMNPNGWKIQDNGVIPNFPTEKTNIICAKGDVVCTGQLAIVLPHLSYGSRAPEQVKFILSKLQ